MKSAFACVSETIALSAVRVRVCHLTIVAVVAAIGVSSHTAEHSRRIEYADLPPALQREFSDAGVTESRFRGYVADVETDTIRRVIEGDREHLIYYALQSGRFTNRPRIEPAVSALRFVEGLPQKDRDRVLDDASYVPKAGWPSAARARVNDLLGALRKEPKDVRLAYFRQILQSSGSPPTAEAFFPDYVRMARFLYKKEFSAARDVARVAELYQSRPHSSDTQIDAGFGVYIGLGVLQQLEPARRITNVLIVGPGLDLAPRTGLIDAADPQSYQPLAVADALLALSLASEANLRVLSVDVNPRVVSAVQAVARASVTWHVFSGVAETTEQPFSHEYRTYVRDLGRAIGNPMKATETIALDRHYQHSIAVRASAARAMSAERLNIITERFTGEPLFDLVIATNVLPYFDDRQLALALTNIAAMMRPGGYFLHNEARAGLAERASSLGVLVVQMRSLVLGGPAARPLYDVVWLHKKTE